MERATLIEVFMKAIEKEIQDEEDNNFGACYHAASLVGLSEEEANECDDGDRNCPECPWKKQ